MYHDIIILLFYLVSCTTAAVVIRYSFALETDFKTSILISSGYYKCDTAILPFKKHELGGWAFI